MWSDILKEAGVSIHVIATGGGAGLQQKLWEVPGSSSYLSGATFPYSPEEQEELLGFMPEHFCSEEAAIDLASAAYMKAFKFGGKKPIGIGIAASVASEKVHHGDHRIHVCIITDDVALSHQVTLPKGVGLDYRLSDGLECDNLGFTMLLALFRISPLAHNIFYYLDVTKKARERFMLRPFFTMDGKRKSSLDGLKHFAIMPGAYNPPHEGHFGLADAFEIEYGMKPIFEVSTKTPHKSPLTIQDMLKRAKMLQGKNRYFTETIPMYIDKAKAFPGTPLVVGADAMVRLFDPKWGHNVSELFQEFFDLKTSFYVGERLVDGESINYENVINNYLLDALKIKYPNFLDRHYIASQLIKNVPGKRLDISSTELRNKL